MRCKTLAGGLLVCCLTDQWLEKLLQCVCLNPGMCWRVIEMRMNGLLPVVVGFVVAPRTGGSSPRTGVVSCRAGLGRGSLRQHLGQLTPFRSFVRDFEYDPIGAAN